MDHASAHLKPPPLVALMGCCAVGTIRPAQRTQRKRPWLRTHHHFSGGGILSDLPPHVDGGLDWGIGVTAHRSPRISRLEELSSGCSSRGRGGGGAAAAGEVTRNQAAQRGEVCLACCILCAQLAAAQRRLWRRMHCNCSRPATSRGAHLRGRGGEPAAHRLLLRCSARWTSSSS